MMMIRVWFWLMAVATVVGCQVENTEPTAGVLVDPDSEQEVPEWVTVGDLDLNRDGTIDIKDLVIMSKFFGQDVPEAEIASAEAMMGKSNGSLPKVCQDIKEGNDPPTEFHKGYTVAIESAVTDNANLKERFNALDGGKYVYALLLLQRMSGAFTPIDGDSLPIEHNYSACFAVRFKVDDNPWVTGVKMKPVSWPKDATDTVIETVSTSQIKPQVTYSGSWDLWKETTMSESLKGISQFGKSQATVYWDWWLSGHRPISSSNNRGVRIEQAKGYKRRCIPIGGEDKVICSFSYVFKGPSYVHGSANEKKDQERSAYVAISLTPHYPWGAYLNMTPAEVRRRYFPEDR